MNTNLIFFRFALKMGIIIVQAFVLLFSCGGVGTVHRYISIEQQIRRKKINKEQKAQKLRD
jgi:hypothetical protein